MSPIKLASSVLIVGLSLASAGCFGRGGGDSASASPSKSRFGLRKKNTATASKSGGRAKGRTTTSRNSGSVAMASADLDGISPEGSMKRDLERLKERERKQEQTVAEMRNALAQGEQMVVKEEQKLHEIRGQVKEFELAMRRYDSGPSSSPSGRAQSTRVMASARSSDEDYVVPASMYADPRSSRTSGRRYQQADYGPQEREGQARENRYASYEQPRNQREQYGREEVLYDGRNDRQPQRAAPPQATRRNYDYQPAPRPQSQNGGMSRPEDDEWIPQGGLFSSSARPTDAPPLQRSRQGGLRPEPAPQGQRQPAPAPAPARNPQPRPVGGEYEEEVFSPDMYLRGGR